MNKTHRKLFESIVNKIMTIKGHYVVISDEIIPVESAEWMAELEDLFGIELCEYNDDYEENLDELIQKLVNE